MSQILVVGQPIKGDPLPFIGKTMSQVQHDLDHIGYNALCYAEDLEKRVGRFALQGNLVMVRDLKAKAEAINAAMEAYDTATHALITALAATELIDDSQGAWP